MNAPAFALFDTPIGTCSLVWKDAAVVGLRLPEEEDDTVPPTRMQTFKKRLAELWTSVAGI